MLVRQRMGDNSEGVTFRESAAKGYDRAPIFGFHRYTIDETRTCRERSTVHASSASNEGKQLY